MLRYQQERDQGCLLPSAASQFSGLQNCLYRTEELAYIALFSGRSGQGEDISESLVIARSAKKKKKKKTKQKSLIKILTY